MVNFRKLAKFALTGSLAFGLIAAAGSMKAQAAKPTVTVDYGIQELTVKPASDAAKHSENFYVVVEIDGKVKSTDRLEYARASSGATAGETIIDISGLSYTKDVKFKIYDEFDIVDGKVTDAEVQELTIKAQPKKIQAKFYPNKASLAQIEIKADGTALSNGTAADGEDAAWEYRTLYSDVWVNGASLTKDVLDNMGVYGTTLIVRKADVTAATDADTLDSTKNSLASKEVKLKIPKKANAPKAAVDPLKITVTIPAKAEWRIVGAKLTSGTASSEATVKNKTVWTASKENPTGWIAATDKKQVLSAIDLQKKVPDGYKIGSNEDASVLSGITVEVKTAATEKKAESKVGYVKLPVQGTAPVKTVDATAKDFTWEEVINEKTNQVTGLRFKNTSQSAMQVAIEESSNVTVGTDNKPDTVKSTYDSTSTKFTTVAAGKEKVFPVKTAAKDKYLFVRFAGVKQTKTVDMKLASALTCDKIVYPEAAKKELNISLTAVNGTSSSDSAGSTKATLTGMTTIDKVYFRSEDKEPKFVPLNSTLTSLSLADANKIGSATKEKLTLTAGKYFVVYEADGEGNIIKYGYTKIEESHIGKAYVAPSGS